MQRANIQHPPFLFEIAWEVANKVGGIYTVLKTKAGVTTREYGKNYVMMGPMGYSPSLEVEKIDPPTQQLKQVIDSMEQRGFKVLFGRWLIDGAPQVILFDLKSAFHNLDNWKGELWNIARIPSPAHDTETNDSVVFGYLAAQFLAEYVKVAGDQAVIAHFHEWLAGVGLILSRKWNVPLATIFTTHATLLGRYLCAGNVDFYNNLTNFDVDHEAGKRGIYHRYCLERAAAHCADVFTTVSHITAFESEHLLKRKPDGVLPNGLNVIKFSAMHEFQNLHAQAKERINDFVRGHFYGHFNFDLDNTVYFFTSGRYEYNNKGVDMFIESLSRLNERLKRSNSNTTVIAFIIMPAKTHSFTVETLKGHAVVKQLKDAVDEIQKDIGKRLFEEALKGDNIEKITTSILKEKEKIILKRRILALKRHTLPPVVTHNMIDDGQDPILNQIRRLQLFNYPSDRVKVIFHPEFINSNNPIINLDYDEFVRGCHLGVFPSYYEPWGYTPAECTVMGVPSITTNLSGFGCYMEETIEDPHDYGIYIVDRRMKGVEESVSQLADLMLEFCQKTRRQRINQRNRTERLSELLDWKRLGIEYMKARHLALRRAYPDKFTNIDPNFVDESSHIPKIPKPLSVPGSPKPIEQESEKEFPLLMDSLHISDPALNVSDVKFKAGHEYGTGLVATKDREEEEDDDDYRPPIRIRSRNSVDESRNHS